MKLNELENGEEFIYKGHKYKRLKKIPRQDDVIDCLDDRYIHRPFRGVVDVEPCQKRLEV